MEDASGRCRFVRPPGLKDKRRKRMRAILTYHSLDESASPISLSPMAFRQHVEWLASGQVRVVGVQELLALDHHVDAVALTFDDGFANFAVEAWPLLRERGLPATVFVVADHVGGDNRWRGRSEAGIPVLPLLDWDALERLRAEGVTIGAHTRTHPFLPALDAGTLDEEMSLAAAEIGRRLGERPIGLAYPYGGVNDTVAREAARHYRWACTTEFRSLRAHESSQLLPRLDMWYFREPQRLSRWGTPDLQAWIWYCRQGRRTRSAIRSMGTSGR